MTKPVKSRNEESVKLIAGHSMILGHLPGKLNLSNVSNKLSTELKQDLLSFGLFDSSSPNYTTYYPEVTVEDLQPKDNEFIEPVFRMLSNTVVQHRWNPIEFPADVLKASMNKLVGLTINADHETALGNGIGSIKAVEWQEEYKIGSLTVPAGINATLKIDGKSNPRIARGIMMDPPSIHSNSVTVFFSWLPSHPQLSQDDFYNKLGTYDSDGKLIRKVANEIMFYSETSLVGMGADPFAQLVKGGKIINPTLAKSRKPILKKSLSADDDDKPKNFIIIDWKNGGNPVEMISNSIEEEDEFINNHQNEEQMELLLRFLELTFGLDKDSLTEENYQAELSKLGTNLTDLTSQVATLSNPTIEGLVGTEAISGAIKELNTLKAGLPEGVSLADLNRLSAIGKQTISDLRSDTARLYRLSLKDKAEDTNIISLINTTDYAGLSALHTQYDSFVEAELKFTCEDCGSHAVTRASAKVTEDEDNDKKVKSTQQLVDKFTKETPGKFTIYGNKK